MHALTRHPETFPPRHERLHVIAGDAVICTIGASFTRKPVEVYSIGARLLVDSMTRRGKRRLLVLISGGVDVSHQPDGIAGRLSRSLMRDYLGKTVHDDMEKMETAVSASDLAEMVLGQLDDDRFIRTIAAVATPGLKVSAWHMFRRELLKR